MLQSSSTFHSEIRGSPLLFTPEPQLIKPECGSYITSGPLDDNVLGQVAGFPSESCRLQALMTSLWHHSGPCLRFARAPLRATRASVHPGGAAICDCIKKGIFTWITCNNCHMNWPLLLDCDNDVAVLEHCGVLREHFDFLSLHAQLFRSCV